MIPTSPIYIQRVRQRAADAVRRISEKPVSLTFRMASGQTIPPQTVRVEHDNSASASESVPGAVTRRKCVIFGVLGHPDIPDTNIRKGFRFVYLNREWEVVSVIDQPGERQAIAESFA